MTYQIKADLLSRKNKIVAKDIPNKEKLEELIDDLTRKGWINIRVIEDKKPKTTE